MTVFRVRKPRVYLAGGMRSGWQDKLVSRLGSQAVMFDPRAHGLMESRQYVKRDLAYVRKADIVFAYFEKTNPSGFGLAVELGYARALNKTIILVDEVRSRYTQFCDEVADFTEVSLDAGIARLESMLDARTSRR